MNWRQVQAIIWLRWRLSQNRFLRAGAANAVLSFFFLAMLISGAVVSGAAGLLLGVFTLPKQSPLVCLAVWDGVIAAFLLFWFAGLLAEIQRSESIEISKLLHLPMSLKQVFVFNYVASHFNPAIVLFLPGMLSLSLGWTLGAGLRMALLIPLVMSFVFMLTAWTYYLRGWLSALMVNKRRRRAIVVWITLGFILVFQLPGMIINSSLIQKGARSGRQAHAAPAPDSDDPSPKLVLPERLIDAHIAVPFGWLGYGAMTLKQNRPWPALGAAVAGCLIGFVGLMRSYKSTIRFYQTSVDGAPASRASGQPESRPRGVPLVERSLPWLPDDTSALALATLRSLLRAPEMKMALLMPIVGGAALSSVPFRFVQHSPPKSIMGFAATAAAVLAVFSFAPVMANAFGLDRNGFRGLVLLPTRRDHILLAKNLAFLPLVASVGGVLLVLAKFVLKAPWEVLLTGLFQILIAYLLFSLMCNLVSILTPYRMAAGTLQAKKPKPIVFLAIGITMTCMPIVLLPAFIPPILQLICSFISGVPAWLPVNLLASVVILCGVASLYWSVLPAQGRLLQRREQRILSEVTEETE